MRTFTRIASLLAIIFASLITKDVIAQTGVLNPDDPIVVYDPSNPPTTPPSGTLVKWVKTNRLSWNTSSFKSYFYKGIEFRLKWPKTWKTNPTATYPLYIFFHGKGEKGTIYDNEYQMYHGGQWHMNAVDNGLFDGFLMYPQIQTDGWGNSAYDVIYEIVNKYLIPEQRVDPFRISVNGLSAGGTAVWNFLARYPKFTAAALPISSASQKYADSVQKYKYTPIWHFQGALDQSPLPSTSHQLGATILAAGGNYTYTEFPNQGHGCWYSAWSMPDYYPFMMRANKTNPWPLTGRTDFCPADTASNINLTIGVTPGFAGYKWRKNGVLISGATANYLKVTKIGTYDCQILLVAGGTWSYFSPIPLVIKVKQPTVTPNIQITGLASKVIPAPDGSTTVPLEVPAGYVSYIWQKDGDTTTVGTARNFNAPTPGYYKAQVTEKYGCSSSFSPLFRVVDANGANKPDPATNVSAGTLSKTSIKLDWFQNGSPAYNETGFEIYQSNAANGAYKLIAITNADVTTYTTTGLNAGITYYYKIRAVNDEGASAVSSPVNATTFVDNIAPTSPSNLHTDGVSRTSVSLIWGSSTDDVGVTSYDIYINGIKSYTTTDTEFTAYNLTFNKTYNFTVKAKDYAGNVSPSSNQTTATTYLKGLTYKYYQGSWNNLPDFNSLSPIDAGVVANVTIDSRLEDDDFGFLFEGSINIPVSGTYTFRTNSDDGSRLYIGALNSTTSPYIYTATPVVDNDGLHGSQDRDGTITLAAGTYPIAITFFEQGGGQNINVYWNTPQTNNSFTPIPDSVFKDNVVIVGTAPAKPTALTATAVSYKEIDLAWTDNSSNETGFEVYRSVNPSGPFATIGVTGSNSKTFKDSTLSANTQYFYKVKAVGKYGESVFNDDGNSLQYSYYETIPYDNLPNFDSLTPKKSGYINNFDISVAEQEDYFAFKYDGIIVIPTDGTYTFYTASDDGSKLYIDGTTESQLVVNNDGLHGTQERQGSIYLTAGVHTIRVTFFERGGAQVLNVSYAGPNISKTAIPDAALRINPINATTFVLPGTPADPTNPNVSATSSSVANLTWTDNSIDESGFQIYRSVGGNTNYLLLKTTTANAQSFNDSTVTANTLYYYKIRSANDIGVSNFTSEVFVTTPNNIPVFSSISDKFMRYGTELIVNISATDVDGEVLNIIFPNGLPSFASYYSTGNGKGYIQFDPQITDVGTYNIAINAADQHSGVGNVSFNLNVNDNYNPAVTPASPVTVAEGQTTTANFSATDANGDALTYSFPNLPSFIQPNISGNNATLQITPGYADNDTYNIIVKVDDGRGGFDSTIFVLNVTDVNPNKQIFVSFNGATTTNADAPWNNTAKAPTAGQSIVNLIDNTGVNTGYSMSIVEKFAGSSDVGYVTGNNTGIYPDNAMKTNYYETSTNARHINLTGLSNTDKYNLIFFASRAGVTDNRTTLYTAGGQSVSLNPSGNTSTTAKISNVTPVNGQIQVTLTRGTGSVWVYISTLVIEKVYDNASAPAAPKNFSLTLNSGIVQLSWRDVAFNETAYEVYRSTSENGTYQQINTGTQSANTTGFSDNNIAPGITYYYKVRAVNSYGASDYTPVLHTAIPNRAPVLAAIANQTLNGGQISSLNVSATDDAGDVLTLSVSNLPAFATFTDNGSGNGIFQFNPSLSQIGNYNNITVTATDNKGASSSQSFNAVVVNGSITTIDVNFNPSLPQALPWNNFNSAPTAGKTVSNLVDLANNNTGISVSIPEKWSGSGTNGAITGNNSGVFPDNVMSTYYYDITADPKHIRFNNLPLSKKYNIVFFASIVGTANKTTTYTVGSQSGSLNASGNTKNVVQLNGIAPDANGQIEVTLTKASGSSYIFINAIELQGYVDDGTPLTPTGLTAKGTSKNKITLNWTDKSSNETGFEIWRAPSQNGNYTLLNTVSANTVTYDDNNLVSGSVFYYKVRAVASGLYSSFTSIASASSFAYVIDLNFNSDNPADGPWNNTNTSPYAGFQLNNLRNDDNQLSGVSFTLVSNFTGTNSLGKTTGNNSGVYPDKVMLTSWYVDHGDTAKLKIDGLNQTQTYNFIFFGSRNGTGTRTSIYQIGNQIVSLNASNNTTLTVQINNVVPDANGAVYISVYDPSNAIYGYLGSLVIQALNSTDSTKNANFYRKRVLIAPTDLLIDHSLNNISVKAYPNPFVDDVILKLVLKEKVSKFGILMTDASGKVVFIKQYADVPKGIWEHNIGINGKKLKNGIYNIQVVGIPGEEPRSVKVMK